MSNLHVLSSRPLALQAAPEVLTEQRLDLDYYLPERVAAEAKINDGRFSTSTLNTLRRTERPITDGIRRHDKSKSGVHLIRTQNLFGPFIDYGGTAFINEEGHRTSLKSEVAPGDLLVAIRGYLGAAAIVVDGAPRANINQHIARIGVDESKCSARYLWAFMSCSVGRTALERYVTGTVQRGVTLPDLRRLRVPLPDRQVQDYIGAKVKLAERCRAASSQSWEAATALLGDALGVPLSPNTFEVKSTTYVSAPGYEVASVRPVIACVEPSRLSGYIGAQFFTPRRAKAILVIEQSGLRVKRMADLSDRFTRRIQGDELQRLSLTYIGLAQIDSTTGFVADTSDQQPTGSSALFSAREILFSKLRPYLNKVAICPDHLEQAAGSTELVTYRAQAGVDPFYLFFVLKSLLVLNQVIDITSGSTHPRVDPDFIDDLLVPLPESSTQKRIGISTQTSLQLMRRATLLVDEAKADVDALLDSTLDVDAILARKVKAPTADDIPELTDDDT